MPDTVLAKKGEGDVKDENDAKIVFTGEGTAEPRDPDGPRETDGHSDFPNHDYQAKEPEGSKVKPDQPSNRPGSVTGAGELPPKSSGAGVDPEQHDIDKPTGLTATGSDHPGGDGFSTTPLPPGVPATLDHYTLESGAVGSTPVKHDPRNDT